MGDKKVGLQGDVSLCCSEVSLKSIRRILEHTEEGVVVELDSLQAVHRADQVSGEVIALLEEFEQVLEEHVGLHMSRGKQHVINLEAGTRVVGVRPFRYPHA